MSHPREYEIALGPDHKLQSVYCDMNSLNPFTTGGDSMAIKDRLPLTEDHYTQKDTSMNRKIWDLIPLMDMMPMGRLNQAYENRRDAERHTYVPCRLPFPCGVDKFHSFMSADGNSNFGAIKNISRRTSSTKK